MLHENWLILLAVGGLFTIFGLVTFFWGRREEKGYFDNIATRVDDMREFLNHWPLRPQPDALKTGGWIAIAVGVVLLIMGTIFWLNRPPVS